jgi:hypothetical protein
VTAARVAFGHARDLVYRAAPAKSISWENPHIDLGANEFAGLLETWEIGRRSMERIWAASDTVEKGRIESRMWRLFAEDSAARPRATGEGWNVRAAEVDGPRSSIVPTPRTKNESILIGDDPRGKVVRS